MKGDNYQSGKLKAQNQIERKERIKCGISPNGIRFKLARSLNECQLQGR